MSLQPSGARQQTRASNVVAMNSRATKGSSGKASVTQSGPPSGGDQAWKDSVDSRLTELRTDVRSLLIGGGVLALTLVGAGWETYTKSMDQMQALAVAQQNISGKFDTMDARITGRLDLLDQKISAPPPPMNARR